MCKRAFTVLTRTTLSNTYLSESRLHRSGAASLPSSQLTTLSSLFSAARCPPALQPGPVCLLLSILSFLHAHAQPADMCPRVRDGQLRGTVLVGHVISTQTVQFFQECADLCEKNPSCFSVNYYDTSDTCELNDRTSFHNPEHMILKNGRYLDIHRPYSDCSDFFCSSDRVCKMHRADRQYCKGISIFKCSPKEWLSFQGPFHVNPFGKDSQEPYRKAPKMTKNWKLDVCNSWMQWTSLCGDFRFTLGHQMLMLTLIICAIVYSTNQRRKAQDVITWRLRSVTQPNDERDTELGAVGII